MDENKVYSEFASQNKNTHSTSRMPMVEAAMNAAVKCMAVELGGKGVRVNAVAPGATNTSMRRQYESYAQDTDSYKINQIRQYLGVCEPEDIANSIAFLLSDKARMITGTCLTVDGGKMST